MPQALNEIPISQAMTGTGAVVGTTYAVPLKTGKGTTVTVNIFFSADPGICSFTVQSSLDGTNWFTIETLSGTNANVLGNQYEDFGSLFFRVNQVAKTNSVTATSNIAAS